MRTDLQLAWDAFVRDLEKAAHVDDVLDWMRPRIDVISMVLILAAVSILYAWVLSATIFAQTHVDLGLDAAKTYSVSAGNWVPATVPSVTVSRDGLSATWSAYFDRGYFFEHDLAFNYERSLGRTCSLDTTGGCSVYKDPRWTVTAGVSHYGYRDRTRDWAWSLGARFRVF